MTLCVNVCESVCYLLLSMNSSSLSAAVLSLSRSFSRRFFRFLAGRPWLLIGRWLSLPSSDRTGVISFPCPAPTSEQSKLQISLSSSLGIQTTSCGVFYQSVASELWKALGTFNDKLLAKYDYFIFLQIYTSGI